MGDGPITETELMAFFANRRIEPEAWQLDAIIALDRLSRRTGDEKEELDD